MQEVSAARDLFAIQVAAPGQVQSASNQLAFNDGGVTSRLIDRLDRGKSTAHGDPMSNTGSWESSEASALSLSACTLRSKGIPVSSSTVMSRASPGIMPYLGKRLAAAVTLGAE